MAAAKAPAPCRTRHGDATTWPTPRQAPRLPPRDPEPLAVRRRASAPSSSRSALSSWMHHWRSPVFGAGPCCSSSAHRVLYTMFVLVARRRSRRRHEGHHTRVVQLASALRHDHVHRLRGDVLRRLVLGLFRRRAVPRRAIQDCARPASPAASGRRRASRPSIPGICRCSTR